ncbi:hypothetical protein [Portibacter marinus]|uniref:hypothetical protein n=1 Tax=Portibacter marinus TaxID=2898660 RepID=UPI001F386897|nr:hypothetical protein [Portibacter marinus]
MDLVQSRNTATAERPTLITHSCRGLLFAILTCTLFCECVSHKTIGEGSQTINNQKVYKVYTYDHEGPDFYKGEIQAEYETVYILPPEKYKQKRLDKGRRISQIGYKRSPVWNKKGDKVAYFSFSVRDSMNNSKGQIMIRDITTGQTRIIDDINPCGCGLSWDETGTLLAFGERDSTITIYDLNENRKISQAKYQGRAEGMTMSPDGSHIIFFTRDGTTPNDADGWRPNLLSVKEKRITKIGLTTDQFGVLSDFYWHKNAQKVIFPGFFLDENKQRTYEFWEYDLRSQEMKPFKGDFMAIQDQSFRYWQRK